MKFKKLISVALAVLMVLLLFCGCARDYSENYVYFDIRNKPYSLDPQIASSDEELLIVRNIFEGLLRKNENGEIVCGVAKDYKKNGLTYTFNLREDALWSDKTCVCAKDFVFALRRAVTPNVKATFANRLLCIKNAKEILEGRMDPSALGVTENGDYSLSITLAYEDGGFPDTLTTSVCMPCNEKFFGSTTGKYGLDAESVIGNGSYVLKKWNPDDFGIRLYKNENYNGDFEAKNGAVFISNKEDETPKDFFGKGSVDCAFVESKYLPDIKNFDLNKQSYQNTAWFITISSSFSQDVRKAFASAFSGDIYKDKLPEGFSVATSIYPSVLTNDKSFGTIPPFNNYDLEKAKSIFSSAVKNMENNQFPSSALYYYDNESLLPCVRAILGHWQKNLSAFVNITSAKHPEELITQLKEKTVDFAVFPVVAKSGDVGEYLINFGKSGNDFARIQNEILADNTILPIAFEDTNICYSRLLSNLYTDNENGYIDFSFAIKKN